MSDPYMKVTKDGTENFLKALQKMKQGKVLVGIPAANNSRKDSEINNATILFINHFGSESANIPPRPVLDIAIKLAQPLLAEEFKKAVQQTWAKGVASLSVYYNRIGMIAASMAKKVINEQIDIQGPAASTLKSRESRGFKGNKALVVTGQTRNAITYVLRENG